jgi:hypothetical protein
LKHDIGAPRIVEVDVYAWPSRVEDIMMVNRLGFGSQDAMMSTHVAFFRRM